jgi:hypothetical protein
VIKLYQTIMKDGKHYVRGYTPYPKGRKFFLLVEDSPENVMKRLRDLQAAINANHPVGGRDGQRDKETRAV